MNGTTLSRRSFVKMAAAAAVTTGMAASLGAGGWQRPTKQQKWVRQRGYARVAAAAEKWNVACGSLLSMVAR